MSIQHVAAVLDSRDEKLIGTRKLVLIALSNRSDAAGKCWPSQSLIADECGISVRAISDHVKALESDGFITRKTQHMGKGNGSRTTYILHLDRLKVAPEDIAGAEVAHANIVGCTGSTPRVTNLQEPTITPNGVSAEDAPTPPKAKTKRTPKRGTRMSETWAPTQMDYAHATKAGLGPQEINHEADQFRDYHISKGTVSKDWAASWRTWCRNAVKWSAKRKPASNGHNASAFIRGIEEAADILDHAAFPRRDGQEFHPARAYAASPDERSDAITLDANGHVITSKLAG